MKTSPAFDIFPKLAGYLDPHLIIPVLDSDFYRDLKVRRRKALRRSRGGAKEGRESAHAEPPFATSR